MEPRVAMADDRMPEHPVDAKRHTERPDACRAQSPKIPGYLSSDQIGGLNTAGTTSRAQLTNSVTGEGSQLFREPRGGLPSSRL